MCELFSHRNQCQDLFQEETVEKLLISGKRTNYFNAEIERTRVLNMILRFFCVHCAVVLRDAPLPPPLEPD